MNDTIPSNVHAKIVNALGDVEDLAKAKGLEDTFEVELFSLRRTVEEARELNDPELASKAMRDARLLWGLLRGTPGRYRGVGALA